MWKWKACHFLVILTIDSIQSIYISSKLLVININCGWNTSTVLPDRWDAQIGLRNYQFHRKSNTSCQRQWLRIVSFQLYLNVSLSLKKITIIFTTAMLSNSYMTNYNCHFLKHTELRMAELTWQNDNSNVFYRITTRE